MASKGLNALVMAASRQGPVDSVAAMKGVSHKCLADIDGVAMIERVVGTLVGAGCFDRIYVSIERAALLQGLPQMAEWLEAGLVHVVESHPTLAESVLAAVETMKAETGSAFPFVITTGDNALHTPAVVETFATALKEGAADITVGVTPEESVQESFEETPIAFHRFKDIAVSGCNLYGMRTENALRAVRVFEGGGQFGKKHWRILKAFGIMPFILYKFQAATCQGLLSRVGRNLGVSIAPTYLRFGFAPIDVDNPASYALSEQILKTRRESA